MHEYLYSLVEGNYLHISDGFKGLQELSGDVMRGSQTRGAATRGSQTRGAMMRGPHAPARAGLHSSEDQHSPVRLG